MRHGPIISLLSKKSKGQFLVPTGANLVTRESLIFASKEKPMRQKSWRHHAKKYLAFLWLGAVAMGAWAQTNESTSPHLPHPRLDLPERTMATALSPEIKQMIDAVRRLYETPGSILDRMDIYKTVDARPSDIRTSKTTLGARYMTEVLLPSRPHEDPRWQIALYYSEFPESDSWSVQVKFDVSKGTNCYSSRLVEAYWGQAFVYQPLGTHAQLREMMRPEGAPPTGPHDGEPHRPEFHGAYPDSASVIFGIGRGGCLVNITAGNRFNVKEYSDDRIYHE